MPRDGSGTFSLVAGNPVVTGTVISSTTHNTTNNDIASALTASIAKDGQTAATGNLPMGGFRHTGVGAGVAATDYATLSQAQVNTHAFIADTSVTVNTVTIAPVPAITAYATGQRFRVKFNTTNTGATTITVSGLASRNIRLQGGANALTADTLVAGDIKDIVYDGTQFIVERDLGRLFDTQIFTASGTWTRPSGCRSVRVRMVGGGGSGGGAAATAAAQHAAGGGGGGGEYAEEHILTPGASETVTIGAGGAISTGAGNAGGNTSFGSHLQAVGGSGGTTAGPSGAIVGILGGAGGTGGTGGGFRSAGEPGGSSALNLFAGHILLSRGGGSRLGSATAVNTLIATSSNGSAGILYGGGSGGAGNTASQGAQSSLAGAAGVMIVEAFG